MTVDLVFDDGPLETTMPILDILAAHRVKATFFLVGRAVANHEDVVRRIRDDGHEIGNHTWSHARLTELEDGEIEAEVSRCSTRIWAVTGKPTARFRPPFVAVDDRVRGVIPQHLTVVDRSSVGDYGMDADSIVAAASEAARSGFVGLHDGHWPTVHALPRILEGLA